MSLSALNGRKTGHAKKQRGVRILADREPKLHENIKRCLLLKGNKSSQTTHQALKDFHKLKHSFAHMLTKTNAIYPFEETTKLEQLQQQNDTSLFIMVSSSKKRPNNIIFGRSFNHQTTQLLEVGMNADTFKSIGDFDGSRKAIVRYNSKPCFLFQGSEFENQDYTSLAMMKNMLLDLFRGEEVSKINLSSIDHVIVVSVVSNTNNTRTNKSSESNNNNNANQREEDLIIMFRHYSIAMKKSQDTSAQFPRVELDEVGPRCDFSIRRSKVINSDLYKQSLVHASRESSSRLMSKNYEIGQFGETRGRIHMQKQNLDNIAVAKFQALKKRKSETDQPEQDDSDDDNNKNDDQEMTETT